ncbi:hypothetical protein EIP91_003338 [Steccherinum ochraceum]|uniref:Aminoglycoside phosphotransferase domain-containing protein n=1 Tax=Steccherinum ochraceum TaxID=92696 RepID=A0A4V2MW58_9APHY|nr:hypothetical protein EIP91_003338 [Steccherinum ochraceum]
MAESPQEVDHFRDPLPDGSGNYVNLYFFFIYRGSQAFVASQLSVYPELLALAVEMACNAAHVVARCVLRPLPSTPKVWLFRLLVKCSVWLRMQKHLNIFRLPYSLVLKLAHFDPNGNEGSGLRLVSSVSNGLTPQLIDYVATEHETYVLMEWIDGVSAADVWDDLTSSDKERIVTEVRDQVHSLRRLLPNPHHPPAICAASGHSIDDPRIPWHRDDPRVLFSCREFFQQVWLGMAFPSMSPALKATMQPYIDRELPVVFCHGDLLPRNLLLPGGLQAWRAGTQRLYLIDWEYCGWMPQPWEALKATWLVVDRDEDEWYGLMRKAFPEDAGDLDADWEWRCRSGIAIV